MRLRVLGKRSFVSFCYFITNITLLFGIVVIIATPFAFSALIPSSVFNIFFFGNQYYISLISLEIGFSAVWLILNEFRKMLKNLINDAPFLRSNAKYLNRIAILSISIGILLFVKCLIDFSYITLIFMFLTFALCAAARIFASIILRAAILKKRLDLVV